MGLKYTKRAMTSYEVHRFFHGLEISFFPDTFIMPFIRDNGLYIQKMNWFGTFCIFILKKGIKYRYKYIRKNKM